MRELHRVAVQGDQTGDDEVFQYVPDPRAQLGPGCRTTGVGRPVTRRDQPEEDAPGDTALIRRQSAVRLLGGGRDRAPYTARLLVRRQRQQPASAAAPGLQQGVRQHGQGARPVDDLVDDRGGERPLHVQTDGRGGAGDRLAQLVPAHRPDQQIGPGDRIGQLTVVRAVAVEVATDRDHHTQPALRIPGGEQQFEEPVPFGPVAAEGEHFLELIDDDPGVPVTVPGNERLLVRLRGPLARREHTHHRRSLDPRRLPQPRDQPRPQQRRLTAAGGPEHRRAPVLAHQVHQLGDQRLPAEEQAAVIRLEAGQPPVGRPLVRRGRPDLGLRLPPAPLPFVRVRVQRLGVRPHHRQGRQLVPGGRLGQRGRGVACPPAHLPVRRFPGLLPQDPQFVRKPLDGSSLRIDRLLPSSHPRHLPHCITRTTRRSRYVSALFDAILAEV
nr:hypothetical protein [Streptomyces caniscabiei]